MAHTEGRKFEVRSRRNAIVSILMLGMMLLGAVTVVLPAMAPVASAQWAASTPQSDGHGGKYNWTITIHAGGQNEPQEWAGDVEYLRFYYTFNTSLNGTTLVDETTIRFKGNTDRAYKLRDLYLGDAYHPPYEGKNLPAYAFIYSWVDPVKLAGSNYNISTIPMDLDMTFNLTYLKEAGVTEITIRFNTSIKRWDGGTYYTSPLVTSLRTYPNKVLLQEQVDRWWGERVSGIWSNWYINETLATVDKYNDGVGGHYNWTSIYYSAYGDEPKEWNHKLEYLMFHYTFGTRLNFTSFLAGSSITVKGDKVLTWKLLYDHVMRPYEAGFYFADEDRLDMGIAFNMEYLKANNVTEISLQFNGTIMRWDGKPYLSQTETITRPISTKDILTNDEINKWHSRPNNGGYPVPLFDQMGASLVFMTVCIPLIMIWIMIAYIEIRNKRLLEGELAKKPKKLKVPPNGMAETVMKLLEKSEQWMRKRRNFVFVTTGLGLLIYFVLSAAFFSIVTWNWSADLMLRKATIVFIVGLSWAVLAVHAYLYKKLRADDMGWTLRIRMLKKREGDYLDALK